MTAPRGTLPPRDPARAPTPRAEGDDHEQATEGGHPAARGRVRAALGRPGHDGPAGRRRRSRFGLGGRPLPLPRRGRVARAVGGVDAAGGPGRGDLAGHAGTARGCHRLPPADRAGQARRHRGRDQRRSARAGSGCRLERRGVRRLRLPPRAAGRPLRGGLHHRPDAAARGPHRLRRPLLPGARLRAAAARSAARGPTAAHRLQRPADAAHHDALGAGLERLVPDVRQLSGGYRRPARAGRCRLPGGGPRPGRGGAHGGRLRAPARSPRRTRPTDPAAPPLEGSPEQLAQALRDLAAEGIGHVQLVIDPVTPAGVAALAPLLEALDAG